jgi:hypothetical protein
MSATSPGQFTPGKRTDIRIEQKAGWAPKPVWTTFRARTQLFNKSMMKSAADQLNQGHTYTPYQFMSLSIYVVLSMFNASLTNDSLPTGFPNTLFNIFTFMVPCIIIHRIE